jgi:hypothetical protein
MAGVSGISERRSSIIPSHFFPCVCAYSGFIGRICVRDGGKERRKKRKHDHERRKPCPGGDGIGRSVARATGALSFPPGDGVSVVALGAMARQLRRCPAGGRTMARRAGGQANDDTTRRLPGRPVPPQGWRGRKRSRVGIGLIRWDTKLFKLGDKGCVQGKAELAFRTPRRFAFRACRRGADRSWSAGATAPLSRSRPAFCPGTYKPISRSLLGMQTTRGILSHLPGQAGDRARSLETIFGKVSIT